MTFDASGSVRLTATQYVGVVSIADGPTIEIRPKAAGTNLLNLLNLLRYAQGVDPKTVDTETTLQAGPTFLDAIGYLFERELRVLLDRGLHSEYRRVSDTKKHLRGQLDIQRQLQRGERRPLTFECEYDELTTDTVTNQSILYATTVLLRLAREQTLHRSLQRHQHLLRQHVTLRPIEPGDFQRIELTRLNNHYTDILRLTELVLQSVYLQELESGSRKTFSLLVDMNRIFEQVVERAIREALSDQWTIDSQHSTQNLVQGGKHTVTIRPNILVRDRDGSVRAVYDAKWKLGKPSNKDFYQLASYQMAYDSPGALIYPEQDGEVASKCVVNNEYSLSLIEVPTRRGSIGYREYVTEIESALSKAVSSVLNSEHNPDMSV